MKYGEAIGKWKLEVGGFDKELTPKKGDARKLMTIGTNMETHDMEWYFDQFTALIKEIINREYPFSNAEEELELDMYIEYNLQTLILETQIAFKMITRAEVEKQKKRHASNPNRDDSTKTVVSETITRIEHNRLEKSLARNVAMVEKEFGAHITDEYPLMKYFNQLELLKDIQDKEEEELKKAKRK